MYKNLLYFKKNISEKKYLFCRQIFWWISNFLKIWLTIVDYWLLLPLIKFCLIQLKLIEIIFGIVCQIILIAKLCKICEKVTLAIYLLWIFKLSNLILLRVRWFPSFLSCTNLAGFIHKAGHSVVGNLLTSSIRSTVV